MLKEFFSHCAIAKSFTQILNTFVTDLICIKAEYAETLNEKMIGKDDQTEEGVVSSHCAIAKSFTQIFNTFVTDLISIKVRVR